MDRPLGSSVDAPDAFADTLAHEPVSIMLVAPSISTADTASCLQLMRGRHPEAANAIHVDFTISPDARLDHWRDHVGVLPADMTLLTVGPQGRPATSADALDDATANRPSVEVVACPHNLTRLGMHITDRLTALEGALTQPRFCFHSVSAFLHYADVAAVFRFLNLLRNHLAAAGAIAHFHVEPDAHDQRTRNQLKPLFDVLIEVDEAGTWELSRR